MLISLAILAIVIALIAASRPAAARVEEDIPDLHSISTGARINR